MDIQTFLEDNIKLVDNNDFEQLYERCATHWSAACCGKLTDTLYACDVDPLKYMTKVPAWFTYNSTLTSMTIPDSITSISKTAFWRCVLLTSITIPDSVTSIREHAFAYCDKLTSINYQGTKAQWEAIAKHQQWKRDSEIKQINCSDGIIKLR